MARSDYLEQMLRHVGHADVLPNGLVVPSLPHGTDWRPGACRGIAVLDDVVLAGNRWPAVSGALLAELARRCAVLAALTAIDRSQWPLPREIAVRFRKAIPVADPLRRPKVADGAAVLYWQATVLAGASDELDTVEVQMTRRPPSSADPATTEVATVEARMRFALGTAEPDADFRGLIERRMSTYCLKLPRRLALPVYLPGWSADEIRGICRERPGSLLAAAEQALADAGKIIRGDGVDVDEEESMLLADLTYCWLADVDDECAEYVARPGPRRRDDKGRDWVAASAILRVGGVAVGEATGNLVFRRQRRVL